MRASYSNLSACEHELHEAAERAVKYSDFGDVSYREGLRTLLNAFDVDLQLNNEGRKRVYEAILWVLKSRLYTEKGWRQYPHALATPISRPIVVLGFARTGTTAMHRLLAMDVQFQGLETWLLGNPMPRPHRDAWMHCAEYRSCVAQFEENRSRIAELGKAHNSSADEFEECGSILLQNYCSCIWDYVYLLPTYSAWRRTQSAAPTYRRYADVLRLIGAHEPQKRWLLKSPSHTIDIDTLLTTFPDACIVNMHRDPVTTIPSLCSWHSMLMPQEEGFVRREQHGPFQCDVLSEALERERSRAASRRLPSKFFHVDYRVFQASPMETICSIYEFFGLELSQLAERRMREWLVRNPTRRYGAHIYPLESWGVTSAEIREKFASYRAQWNFE